VLYKEKRIRNDILKFYLIKIKNANLAEIEFLIFVFYCWSVFLWGVILNKPQKK